MPAQLRSFLAPSVPPHTDTPEGTRIVEWARRAFDANIRRINSPSEVRFEPAYTPPAKPDPGMVVFADGSHWNPGSGVGLYYYGFDHAWHFSGNGGGAGAGVTSWNGRIGAVTLTLSDVTGAGGAPSASPIFTGDPQAPTAAPGDNDTSVATTAFVTSAIGAAHTGVSDGSDAAIGAIGEFRSIALASLVLTSGVISSLGSLVLAAGDWDVWAFVAFAVSGGAMPTTLSAGLSPLATSTPSGPSLTSLSVGDGSWDAGGGVLASSTLPLGTSRSSSASSQTLYLNASGSAWSSGAVSVSGSIFARRSR